MWYIERPNGTDQESLANSVTIKAKSLAVSWQKIPCSSEFPHKLLYEYSHTVSNGTYVICLIVLKD